MRGGLCLEVGMAIGQSTVLLVLPSITRGQHAVVALAKLVW